MTPFVFTHGFQERTVAHLLAVLERAEPGLGAHSERVAQLSRRLAIRLGLGSVEQQEVWWAACLHDLGKLTIEREVLLKRGPLNSAEWAAMRDHPRLSEQLAARLVGPQDTVLAAIRSHHERWDGGGYPDGLRGEQIPPLARIIAVCDVFDALQSARPYKPAWSSEAALAEVRRGRGTQFEPTVLEAFEALVLGPGDQDGREWAMA